MEGGCYFVLEDALLRSLGLFSLRKILPRLFLFLRLIPGGPLAGSILQDSREEERGPKKKLVKVYEE